MTFMVNPFVMFPAGGAAAPTDYIHFYTFDSISGSSLIDEGSSPVNGVISSGVTTGVKNGLGSAAHFDGSNNANITLTGHDFWTSAFTFNILCYLDAVAPALGKSIYTAGVSFGAANERSFDIFVRNNNAGIGCILSDGSSYLVVLTGSIPVPEKQLFMLTVKWDGTTSTDGLVIKINDSIYAQGTVSSGTPSSSGTPRLGGFQSASDFEWIGAQGYLKIYDRFLSDEEDTANFNEWAYTPTTAGIPTPSDDNVIYEVDTTTAIGWSGSAVTSDGTALTLTANGSVVSSELSITGPSFGDYIFYGTFSAENTLDSGVNFQLGGAGDNAILLSLGYNWETASYETNRVSVRIGATGVAGPTIDFSTTQVDVALQYDSRLGVGNFFIRESGFWTFYGSASLPSPYKNRLTLSSGGNHVNDGYVNEWFIAYPNYAVVGDSIAEGATLFSPNPSDYAGDDDYQSTWMYWANTIGSTLRNNLIVNYGIGSEDSGEMIARVDEAVFKTQCRTLFIHASTNDFGAPINNTDRTINIQASIDRAKLWDSTQVVLLNAVYPNIGNASYPDNADQYRDWWTVNQPSIVRASSKLDIMGGSTILDGNYMDVIYTQSDGVHPNVDGYELIGNYIESQE